MIISKINTKKSKISMLLLSMFVYGVIEPPVAYALTSGPTSPEAMSFEPIDTTDMVNPLTGSFTYNIPLVEVPGPEGGYPLSLSYHAGIMPNMEASWAGLGWNINPGAINRHVGGFPDDFKEVEMTRHDSWSGGTRLDFNVGVGYAGYVNAGLQISHDSNQGFASGVGASLGYGGVGLSYSNHGFDGTTIGLNVGFNILSSNTSKLDLGVSVQKHLETGNVSTGLNVGGNIGHSTLGISMSNSGLKASLQMGGSLAEVVNSKVNNISTDVKGIGGVIPLGTTGAYITLGLKRTKYWLDETESSTANGSMYLPYKDFVPDNYTYFSNRSSDVYRLIDFPNRSILDGNEQYEFQGGNYPEYDQYTVLGQGIGGNIRPFLFQRPLYTRNSKSTKRVGSTNKVMDIIALSSEITGNAATFKEGVGFRFENDFSNAFTQGLNNIPYVNSVANGLSSYPFGGVQNTISYTQNQLPGSRHIAHFTNNEINSGAAEEKGFINVSSNTKGFQRLSNGNRLNNTKGGEQIGGFSITNSSGVTYHYALPAYTYKEFTYSQNSDGSRNTYTERFEPYAYTWLLTAITGPDFVDRNSDGKIDSGDWGYWVEFDYGKWSDEYNWRNPSLGVNQDVDFGYSNLSRGKKEIYYLNSIRTRTHFALFEKDIRTDAKGASDVIFNSNYNQGQFDASSASSLRLSKIHLFNIDQFNNIDTYITPSGLTSNAKGDFRNIFDASDVDNGSLGRIGLESQALRIIDLVHDYSLVPGTTNSFSASSPSSKQGKLTLKSLAFRGKGGVQLTPKTEFVYEDNSPFSNITFNNSYSASDIHQKFDVGDMLITESGQYCGVITKRTVQGSNYNYEFTNGSVSFSSGTNVSVKKTKNPPFHKDAYDIWGNYKPDVNLSLLQTDPTEARRTTLASAATMDAWALRKIKNPLGSNIEVEYAGGDFSKSVLNSVSSVVINSITALNNDNLRLYISNGIENFSGPQVKYSVGDYLKMVYFMKFGVIGTTIFGAKETTDPCGPQFRLTSVGSNYIDVYTPNFGSQLIACFPGSGFTGVSILTGNIWIDNDNSASGLKNEYGGRIRTRSIAIVKNDGTKNITEYNYSVPNSTVSSGVTVYTPNYLERDVVNNFIDINTSHHVESRTLYRKRLYKKMEHTLAINRELPPPGVTYEYVTALNKTIHPDGTYKIGGKTQFKYRVFEKNMIEKKTLQNEEFVDAKAFAHNSTIRNYTSNVGDLLNVIYYDNENRVTKRIDNHYLYDDVVTYSLQPESFNSTYLNEISKYGYQGVVMERFGDYRSFRWYENSTYINYRYTMVMSSKESYPSVLLRTTTTEPLLGHSVENQNTKFDKISGMILETVVNDHLGNKYLTEVIPAYTKYPKMGLKLVNNSNKNMLTQVAGEFTYKFENNGVDLTILRGHTFLWSNNANVLSPDNTTLVQNSTANGDVWRRQASFSFMPNYSYFPYGLPKHYGSFNWNETPQFYATSNSRWMLDDEITLFNTGSRALESKDVNNYYSSSRMGYKNSMVTLSSTGGGYYESVFSGAEDEQINTTYHDRGLVLRGDATLVGSGVVPAHTGSKSLQLTNGQKGFVYQLSTNKLVLGRDYHAAVWIYGTPTTLAGSNTKLYYKISGTEKGSALSTGIVGRTAGNWTLMYLPIKGSDIIANATLEVGVLNSSATHTAYVDDFRFYPKGSVSNAYVYDQWGEMTHTLNALNLFTRYEYDAMGRLKAVYLEQFGKQPYKVSEHEYKYAKPI